MSTATPKPTITNHTIKRTEDPTSSSLTIRTSSHTSGTYRPSAEVDVDLISSTPLTGYRYSVGAIRQLANALLEAAEEAERLEEVRTRVDLPLGATVKYDLATVPHVKLAEDSWHFVDRSGQMIKAFTDDDSIRDGIKRGQAKLLWPTVEA